MVRKITLVILTLFVSVLSLFRPNSLVTIFASDNVEQKSSDEWRYICQTDPRWANNPLPGFSGSTVGGAGCLMCSVFMLMGYDDKQIRDWDYFNTYLVTKPGVNLVAGDGTYLVPEKAPNFTYVGQFPVTGSSTDKAKTIKSWIEDDGYYVVIHINGGPDTSNHWMAITGMDGDTPIIQDPGYATEPGYDISWTGRNPYVDKAQVYKGSRRADETLIGYCDDFGASNVKTKVDDNVYEIKGTIFLEESEMKGMEEVRNYLARSQISLEQFSKMDLSYHEQDQLAQLKTEINRDKFTLTKGLNTAVSICGILVIVVALMLVLAYLFDTSSFLGGSLSLVTLLTFNKLHIQDTNEDFRGTTENGKTMTPKQFWISVACLFILGIAMVTGSLNSIISWITNLL